MDRERDDALLRAALGEEAGALWPPPTLWPRVQAALTRPAEGAPALTRPSAELRSLLRRGDLRLVTLSLLAEREADAFTLARRVEGLARAAALDIPPEGVLLPVLHRLEGDRLVEARWRPGPGGLRRAYTLSARGRRMRRRALSLWRIADAWVRLGRLVPRRTATLA